MTAGGLVLPPFCDSHVHLDLVEPRDLIPGGIGRVLDLGSDPAAATTWEHSRAELPEIDFAGPLLTAPGGYPLHSGWASPATVREVRDAPDAAMAITDLLRLGARVAKVALNSEAGPVWDDELLAIVVEVARSSGLPVVAHAQGNGQAERALNAGVSCLAHTPWTEQLSDELIGRMAGAMSWISTLDIHGWGDYGGDFDRAHNNLERFAASGGVIHYGTDLGNGPLPVGINIRELEALSGAGLSIPQLLATLRGAIDPRQPVRFASIIPGAESVHDISGIDQIAHAVLIERKEQQA